MKNDKSKFDSTWDPDLLSGFMISRYALKYLYRISALHPSSVRPALTNMAENLVHRPKKVLLKKKEKNCFLCTSRGLEYLSSY